MTLLTAFIASIGFNLLMFIPAYFFRTDKLTDISYALTFAFLAGFGFAQSGSFPSLILFGMILLWAIRLGGFLLIRVWKHKKDSRFDGMRESFLRFLRFWLLQGLTVWAVLIPSILFFNNAPAAISPYASIGSGLWIIGLLIEAIADWQKYQFKNDTSNKGKWIESGLWKYSRHPNYFGEILLWIGVYVYTLFGLNQTDALIGAIGPIFIASLIIFVSGIPILEKKANEKWGDDPQYQKYKKGTGVLIPKFHSS